MNNGVLQRILTAENYCSYDEFYECLRQDLETLLNYRGRIVNHNTNQLNCPNATLYFGAPDFTAIKYNTEQGKNNLCHELEIVINQFEKRLSQVHVTYQDHEEEKGYLKILIEATVMIDKKRQSIAFNSEIDPANQAINIR